MLQSGDAQRERNLLRITNRWLEWRTWTIMYCIQHSRRWLARDLHWCTDDRSSSTENRGSRIGM